MLTRHYKRGGFSRVNQFLSDPTTKLLTPRHWWMYRYHHNKRLRAAFLLDHRMGRYRG